jgi:hypothetical protein
MDTPAAATDGRSCGCAAVVRIGFRATCQDCGYLWLGRTVLPSSGSVGQPREVFASCVRCGGHATGSGKILEVLTAVH